MKKIGSLIVAIMLCLFGGLLAGCNKDYSKITVSANFEKIEDGTLMLNIGETSEIDFKVENMPKGFNPELNLSLSANKVSTEIISSNADDGSCKVEVTAISFGDCVLRAMTQEGGKYIDINIKVQLAVEDFSLNDEIKLFAVRGQNNPKNLELNNSFFTFTPYGTTQKDIVWYDSSDEDAQIITQVVANDYEDNVNVVEVYAKSPYLDKVVPVSVEIIDEIGATVVNELTMDSAGSFVLGDELESGDNLILVTNRSEFARQNLRLTVNNNTNPLLKSINRYSSTNIVLATIFDATVIGQENLNTYFNISLQALNEGRTDIEFAVCYSGYPGYEVVTKLSIDVISAPEKLLVNDIAENFPLQVLYDNVNSTVESVLNISLAPNTAIFDKIVLEPIMSKDKNFSDYIKLSCGGIEISPTSVLTNISLPIVAKGLQSTKGQTLQLKLSLYWGQNQGIYSEENQEYEENIKQYIISFEVKTGAANLNIDDQDYVRDGIYLDLNDGEKIFEGLYVAEKDAWIDGLKIFNLSTQNVAKVEEYVLENDTRVTGKTVGVKITPMQVGTTRYAIYLPNGVFRDLIVNVVDTPKSIKLDVDDLNSPLVTLKSYNDSGVLNKVNLKLQQIDAELYQGSVKFKVLVDGVEETSFNSNLYNINITKSESNLITFDNETKILTANENFNSEALTWQVNLKFVEEFKLKEKTGNSDDDDTENADFEGAIVLNSFVPIDNVNFSKTEISLYSKKDLGLNYKNESKDTIILIFNPNTDKLAKENIDIRLSASVESTFSNNILTITGYGIYNIESGDFELDVNVANPQSFNVYATVSYNGQIFTKSFKVNPLDYIQVRSIKLNNHIGKIYHYESGQYIDGIYLSPTKNYSEIYTYVMPLNAIHQELVYRFEPSTGSPASIVRLENITVDGKGIGVRVIYGNNGGGSGELVIIAQSTIDNLSQTPQNALKIPISVGDGSYSNPFKISSAEEFIAIKTTGLDKHYVISNTIDLSNYKLNMGEFTGTINGMGVGKIVGINITQMYNGYAGLFDKIVSKTTNNQGDAVEHSGEIKNLVFEGSINLEVNTNDLNSGKGYIGLICGELGQNALLENITVKLFDSNVQINTASEINIGGIVGLNSGIIQTIIGVNENKNIYTNLNMFEAKGQFVVNSSSNGRDKNSASTFGGIAGINNGSILRITNQQTQIVGNGNYLAIVDMYLFRSSSHPNSNFATGSVVGKNIGTISAYNNAVGIITNLDTKNYTDYIKTTGKIKLSAQDYNIVGGLVGLNTGTSAILQYAITRTKIMSLGDSAQIGNIDISQSEKPYIGGIYGINNEGKIAYCLIQSLENGTSIGIDATLIYSKFFGLINTDNNVSLDSTKISVFGFDSINNEKVTDLQAITYVGESEDVAGREIVKPFEENVKVYMTTSNYYGDIFVGDYDSNQGVFYQQRFDVRKANLVVENAKNPMYCADQDQSAKEIVSYTYIYQASNSQDQYLLENLNTILLPFGVDGEISIVSFNENIIYVNSDGSLRLLNTGLARLRVFSMLNAKVYKDVYIYVVGAFDNFSLILNSALDIENTIETGRLISVLSGEAVVLNVEFRKEAISMTGYDIEIVSQSQGELIDVLVQQNQKFSLEKVGLVYVLKALNDTGNQDFNLKVFLSFKLNNSIYTTLYKEDDVTKGYLSYVNNGENYDYEVYFSAKSIQGTTNIKLNGEEVSLEPTDEYDIQLRVDTDKFDEKLEIDFKKYNNGSYLDSEFLILEEKGRKLELSISDLWNKLSVNDLDQFELINPNIYLIKLYYTQNNYIDIYINIHNNTLSISQNSGFAESITVELIADEYDFKIFGENNVDVLNKVLKLNTIVILYNLKFDLSYLSQDYVDSYNITWTAESTNISKALVVNVMSQQLNKIVFESFEGGQPEDIYSGKEQSIYLNPGSSNHFRITVIPVQAEYDHIIITANSDKFLLTWINENAQNLNGAVITNNGLRLTKEQVDNQNGIVLIKYIAGTFDVDNGDVFNFDVIAYKDGIDFAKASKQIVIKYAKDVTLNIVGKEKINGTYYLTRGSTYDYSLQNFGYNIDEIIINTNRNDLITVNKVSNKIQITTNNISYPDNSDGGILARIIVYGEKMVDGELVTSVPDTISILITEYNIVESNDTTIVKGGANGVVSVAMGDSYVFDTELVGGINAEFSNSINDIKTTAKIFTDSVTKNAVWQYQIASKNQDGEYYFANNESAWLDITSNITSEDTVNNFVINFNQNKITFLPLKVHNNENPRYRFRIKYGYEYSKGVAVFKEYNENELRTFGSCLDIFTFNIYQLSSMDTPTPISSQKELMEMQDGAYYIMTDDIELTSDFVPLKNQIAGLDGNGKNIILASNLSGQGYSNFGIFETIAENSLIRNATILIQNSIRWTINSVNSVSAGLLAGENKGIVTNCSVVTQNDSTVRMLFPSLNSANIYVGGLVGTNNGFITASRVSINITSSSNLAGFVCVNNCKIASSSVFDSLIINTSAEIDSKTAGFVCYNDGDKINTGIIITSYISGIHIGELNIPIYANDNSRQLRSSAESAGFIYENKGKIADCYSDIPIVTSSKSAGFVFNNKGDIINSFSTSMLKSLSQESYGFVFDNAEGDLFNCIYLAEDGLINHSINASNYSISGLQVFDIDDFSNADNFSEYAISEGKDIIKGIWFFPQNATESIFNNEGKQFVKNRLELISANIISVSKQQLNLDLTVTDEITGEVTYAYNNIGESQGSIHNPFVIINAEYFEYYVSKTTTNTINLQYYRFVADIDYDQIANSNLYNTIFAGDIEGNGMVLKNYVIDTSASMTSAGLFSKVGNGSTQQGCVKNLTLKPKFINLPNAICVGALAGTLDGGCIFNVDVDGSQNNSYAVVLGKNIVGGIVGRAISDFKMINCSSTISANSTFRSPAVLGEGGTSQDKIGSYFLIKNHTTLTLAKTSYAGSIAGVLAGTGYVSNVKVGGSVAAIGEFAGLLFGGIGNGVTVSNIDQQIINGQFIQSAVFGGVLAGECYGFVYNVNIYSSVDVMNFFNVIPFKAFAVGGLVGLMGDSTNLPTQSQENYQNYGLSNVKVATNLRTGYINTIGGLVGEYIGGKIEKSGFVGSISGKENVGGLIGRILTEPTAIIRLSNLQLLTSSLIDTDEVLNECYVKGGELSVYNDNVGLARVGGLVGDMYINNNDSGNYVISNCYNTNNIYIKSDIYGSDFDIFAGGLIGIMRTKEYIEGHKAVLTLKMGYCYSTAKISLDLRDMKELAITEELRKDKYRICYSDLIAFNEGNAFDIWIKFLQKTTTTVKYQEREISYTTTSDDNHTINLTYYKYDSAERRSQLYHYTRPSDVELENYFDLYNAVYFVCEDFDEKIEIGLDKNSIGYDITTLSSILDFTRLSKIWIFKNQALVLVCE